MASIYIVDYLGIHCGMHYYNESFRASLSRIPNVHVEVLSNYSSTPGQRPFFLFQYGKTPVHKGIALLRNLQRLHRFVGTHRDDTFIFLTYGNEIDLLYMREIARAPKHFIDIHEVIAQSKDHNLKLHSHLAHMYASRIRHVIVHSHHTDEVLDRYGFNGLRLRVPHFKYMFPRKYEDSRIASDVTNAISSDRRNLLFFGNINRNKGVDILLESLNGMPDEISSKLNVIVAGKDNDGACHTVECRSAASTHLILRHITDDELVYLYSKSDAIALPYRKTSQSGILEMAFYFRKPIIASDIPYFRTTLEMFPSFGNLAGNSAEEFGRGICSWLTDNRTYYDDCEYARYENREEIEHFISEFAHHIV